jgi:uncharacterized protein (TIGR00730 family)
MTVNLQGRRIAVFCGAREVAPDYFALARITGAAIAESGATLIYGSGNVGLMGAVSAGAREHGGNVIGVKPEFMVDVEDVNTATHQTIVTSHMHARKAWMEEQSDAFIVLPGGLGTLDELITVMTTKQLRQHRKPIVLLDPTNYYAPLLHLFDHMIAHEFVHPVTTPLPHHAETPGEALTYIQQELQASPSPGGTLNGL